MLHWTHVLTGIALLVGWLVPVVPAHAVFPPAIKDDGKFFKPEAVEKANKKIKEIYEKYKKDVVIETTASLTADQEKKLKDEGDKKFYPKLALERARELGVNGVYVWISKNPKQLRVHMDPGTQKKAFTASDREKMIKAFFAQFKEGKFDEGLLDGLEVVESALKANTK